MTDLSQSGQQPRAFAKPGPALGLFAVTASLGALELFGLRPGGSFLDILQSTGFAVGVLLPGLGFYLIIQNPKFTAFVVLAWVALVLAQLEIVIFLWGLGRIPRLLCVQAIVCAGVVAWQKPTTLWQSLRPAKLGTMSFFAEKWAIAAALLLPFCVLGAQRLQGISSEGLLYPAAEAVQLPAVQGALPTQLPFGFQISLPAGTRVVGANPKDGTLYINAGSFFCAFHRDNRMDQGLRGLHSMPFDLRGLMDERFGMVPKVFKQVCLLAAPDRFLRLENQRLLAYAAIGKSADPNKLEIDAAVWDGQDRSLGAFDVYWPTSMGPPQAWLATLDVSPPALSADDYLARANAADKAGRLQEQGLFLACAALSLNPGAKTVRKFADYLSGQKLTKAAKSMNAFAQGL